MWTYYYSRI